MADKVLFTVWRATVTATIKFFEKIVMYLAEGLMLGRNWSVTRSLSDCSLFVNKKVIATGRYY
jgi:hypothetical protein